jgi:hypothetical protein
MPAHGPWAQPAQDGGKVPPFFLSFFDTLPSLTGIRKPVLQALLAHEEQANSGIG